MIINSLTLENFRVFKGKHQIDLRADQGSPIILFGGLNGAGKTSILTAVKLALFGKAALKGNLTKSHYHHYLQDQINRGDNDLNSASVAIQFVYSKLGKQYRYLVERLWRVDNNKVKESLSIQENGKTLSELSLTQAQSFIFDLVPLGIADLFFFDGEKIQEMADDEDGHVLIEALKKLVGVDLVEKAAFDTGVVLRKNKKLSGSLEERKEIDKLEQELKEVEESIESKTADYGNNYLPYQAELEIKLKKAKQKLDESGGEWAKSRDDLISEQGGLNARKKELEAKITELFRGDIIFNAAPSFLEKLSSQLQKDLSISKSIEFNDQLDQKIASFKNVDPKLSKFVNKLKNKGLSDARHQVSSYQYKKFEDMTNNSGKSKEALKAFIKEYESLESSIDSLGLNISRAPDESQLKKIFTVINGIELEIEKANNRTKEIKREIRELLNEAIQLTHNLDKVYSKLQSEESSVKVDRVGNKVISAMESLSRGLIQGKISELELEFNKVFQRLTRKKDMSHQVNIDRKNYKIELLDKFGNIVNKKRISSGEKQIYAFSMIEALGKVSGRNLPFIVDTPLGRLDSNHRSRLVKNFFPKIGEQVIVLSTDTEVDSQFYEALMPFISKSYEIQYNETESSSSVEMGYFWSSHHEESEVEIPA